MSILDWFAKKQKVPSKAARLNIPGDLWVKCPECSEVLFTKDLDLNFKVCNHCNYHFRLSPEERLRYLFDKDSFCESDANIKPIDVLKFSDTQKYSSRIKNAQ